MAICFCNILYCTTCVETAHNQTALGSRDWLLIHVYALVTYRNSRFSSNIKTKLLKESRTGCTLCTKFKRAAIQWFVLKPGKLCDYDALGNSSIMDPFLKTASIDNSRNICALPVYLTEILMHWFIQSIERCRFSLIQSSH